MELLENRVQIDARSQYFNNFKEYWTQSRGLCLTFLIVLFNAGVIRKNERATTMLPRNFY